MIHHILECGWGVGQSEGHDVELVEAVARVESCLPFVSFPDSDQGESTLEVYLREELGSSDPVLKFLHERE
jgi:hypothetical protein